MEKLERVESSPLLSLVGHFKFDIDQQTQGLFYITALAIMQDFRDNEKKQLKMTATRPFWIFILFYMHGPAILLCF